MHKPTRRVRRFVRKAKGKGKRSTKGQGKSRYDFLDQLPDDEHDYAFYGGKGKSKGKRRSSGKGKGRRKNPVGRDGTIMTCSICGSEEHFRAECPRNAPAPSTAALAHTGVSHLGATDIFLGAPTRTIGLVTDLEQPPAAAAAELPTLPAATEAATDAWGNWLPAAASTPPSADLLLGLARAPEAAAPSAEQYRAGPPRRARHPPAAGLQNPAALFQHEPIPQEPGVEWLVGPGLRVRQMTQEVTPVAAREDSSRGVSPERSPSAAATRGESAVVVEPSPDDLGRRYEVQRGMVEMQLQIQNAVAPPVDERPIQLQVPVLGEFWRAGQARLAAPAVAPAEGTHPRPAMCPWEHIGNDLFERPVEDADWHMGIEPAATTGSPSLAVDLVSFSESMRRLREVRASVPETERTIRLADAARMAAQLEHFRPNLPTDTEVPQLEDDDDRLYCSICMNTVEDEEWISTLRCSHSFHVICLDEWCATRLATNDTATCPHCRQHIEVVTTMEYDIAVAPAEATEAATSFSSAASASASSIF